MGPSYFFLDPRFHRQNSASGFGARGEFSAAFQLFVGRHGPAYDVYEARWWEKKNVQTALRTLLPLHAAFHRMLDAAEICG
jgi:hypothetical protein